ncbi:FAD-dependent monooxygenase, partial [Acinetobacter baumannii]
EVFDEWLRARAASGGAQRRTGNFERIERDPDGTAVVVYESRGESGDMLLSRLRALAVIGADGANSAVAKQAVPNRAKPKHVFAYHE